MGSVDGPEMFRVTGNQWHGSGAVGSRAEVGGQTGHEVARLSKHS